MSRCVRSVSLYAADGACDGHRLCVTCKVQTTSPGHKVYANVSFPVCEHACKCFCDTVCSLMPQLLWGNWACNIERVHTEIGSYPVPLESVCQTWLRKTAICSTNRQ